jgi:hypothetical protein
MDRRTSSIPPTRRRARRFLRRRWNGSGNAALQPLDDELFGGAIGLGHQIEFALQLKADVALEEAVEQCSSFAGDLR